MIKLSIEAKKLEEIETLSRQALNGMFTPEELAGSSKITLAGKLAAKTAFLKNAGMPGIPQHYRKTEVTKTPSGRPAVKILDAELNEKISKFQTSVSISHTQNTAIAICVFYNTG
ncbi:MAG: hypothetical protein JW957_04580 [Candidatus Omnitrophica bacterium]|nr:hypothetical protein [Candidatus Omnitrophota bacterium]